MILTSFFIPFVYQPLLNVLIALYWLLNIITNGKPDMGVAVILLTVFVRILLLPLSLMGDKSEKERRQMAAKIQELEQTFRDSPIVLKSEKQRLFKEKPGVVIGELVTLTIQVTVSLVLWRIFAYGLSGQDWHYIYGFMPAVKTPFNLMFLGKYDLTHPHIILNIVQSLLIFALETLAIVLSPYPHSRGEVVRLQLVLPLISFFIFMYLPAGKKLFVITTLIFSIILTLFKAVGRWFDAYKEKIITKQNADPANGDQILVEVK